MVRFSNVLYIFTENKWGVLVGVFFLFSRCLCNEDVGLLWNGTLLFSSDFICRRKGPGILSRKSSFLRQSWEALWFEISPPPPPRTFNLDNAPVTSWLRHLLITITRWGEICAWHNVEIGSWFCFSSSHLFYSSPSGVLFIRFVLFLRITDGW